MATAASRTTIRVGLRADVPDAQGARTVGLANLSRLVGASGTTSLTPRRTMYVNRSATSVNSGSSGAARAHARPHEVTPLTLAHTRLSCSWSKKTTPKVPTTTIDRA